MRKILFLITKSNWGGAQRYVYDLATSLPQRQFKVVVGLGDGDILLKKLREKSIRTLVVEHLKRDIQIASEIKVFLSLFRLLRKERPDIVHLNSSKMAGLGAMGARLLGIQKIIFTVHGWPFNEDRNVFSKALIWYLSWITGLFSTHVITVSLQDYRQACKMPFLKKRTIYIKNGIGTTIPFLPKQIARRKVFGVIKKYSPDFPSRPRFVIGTVAELTENKGLTYAIDAIAKLRKKIEGEIVYIVIGEGGQRRSLERRVRGLGLTKVVFLPGFIDDVASLLKAFDVFVLPSVKEGMPYSLLESGLAGLPTITTDVGGTSDIVENKKTGLVIPSKNSDVLSHALEEILLGKSDTRYGLLLQRKIIKEFSLSRMVEETVRVYIPQTPRNSLPISSR